MSVPVALTALAERIDEYGDVAHLVTVGDDSRPHLVSVTVGWHGDDLVAGAGRTTSRNVGAHPTVSLVWAAAPGADYSLIVDGSARVDGDGDAARVVVRPSRAVLHRVASSAASLPSCVTVL